MSSGYPISKPPSYSSEYTSVYSSISSLPFPIPPDNPIPIPPYKINPRKPSAALNVALRISPSDMPSLIHSGRPHTILSLYPDIVPSFFPSTTSSESPSPWTKPYIFSPFQPSKMISENPGSDPSSLPVLKLSAALSAVLITSSSDMTSLMITPVSSKIIIQSLSPGSTTSMFP